MVYQADERPPDNAAFDGTACDCARRDINSVLAANGCDQPCPDCKSYYSCIIPGPHGGPHYCSFGHSW
jgi:hypothetical protein